MPRSLRGKKTQVQPPGKPLKTKTSKTKQPKYGVQEQENLVASSKSARSSATKRSRSKKTAGLPVLPSEIDVRRERRGARGAKRA